jgi:galactokinase
MSSSLTTRLIDAGMSEHEAHIKTARFADIERQLPAPGGTEPLRWFVPGRIEVLGKHTDYAGGRSLLCTAERGFCIAAVLRSDSLVRINDIVRRKTFELVMSSYLKVPDFGWTVYPSVVARRVSRNFPGAMRGADIAFANDLPSAAGMSTSSALVVAIFAVLSAVNNLPDRAEYDADIQTLEDLAGYLGCIENGQSYKSLVGDSGVGTFGGSQDHTAILTSQAGSLKQYSFCPVRFERSVKAPDDCVFVIGVSGVSANKTGSAKARYNRASQAVRSILEIWNSATRSHATTLAAAATSSPDAPDHIRAVLRDARSGTDPEWFTRRFEQFWLESERIIPSASDALTRGDLQAFGTLVDQSQAATDTLLGNQILETVWLARQARCLGAHAASAFGAGFGGSVWALVDRTIAEDFAQRWQHEYKNSRHPSAHNSQFFVTAAGPPLMQL